LEKFRALATRQFGSMHDAWTQLIDKDKSGTVNFYEFRQQLKFLGYSDEEELLELFNHLLTVPGVHYIAPHDVKFLQTWEEKKQEAVRRKRLRTAWVNKDPYLPPSKAGSVMTSNPSWTTLGTVDQSAVVEDFGSFVAMDVEQQKKEFQKFLIQRFGSLCEAFDIMDANDSGQLSMVEFQTQVSAVMRYCRPSDAARLFLSFNKDPIALISWEELGIQRHEWVNFQLEKEIRKHKQQLERRGDPVHGHPVLGSSPRQQKGYTGHIHRVRNPSQRADVAFGMPLPKEWGKPPHFQPRTTVTLPPLSAR